jgi:predicted amino acid dehydrogenase
LSRAARRELAHKLMALTELRPVMVSAENLLCDRLWFATFSIPGDVATLEGLHRAGDRALVVERIQEAVDRAADQGCEVVALGAFTSILSRDGEALVAPPGVQLTTGNTLTVATGALQLRRACVQARLGREGAPPRLAVVGAAGNIGAGLVAHLTSPASAAPRFNEVLLLGRNRARLEAVRQRLLDGWRARWGHRAPPRLEISTELRDLARVDAVAIATNTNEPLIYPSHLEGRGAVVIADISTPSAVSAEARALPHVTVVPLAGLVSVPGAASFVMSAASAPGMAFCCAAEAMILGLEPGPTRALRLVGRVEPRHVERIDALARTHGFYDQVAGGGYRQRQESS